MSEVIEPLPFQEPSQALFELLAWRAQMRADLMHVCGLETQHKALQLHPAQVERLLTLGYP